MVTRILKLYKDLVIKQKYPIKRIYRLPYLSNKYLITRKTKPNRNLIINKQYSIRKYTLQIVLLA